MKNIVCFGEVLWDVFPTKKCLGGAPFNVTLRAQQLGNKAALISAVGNDDYGSALIKEIENKGAMLEHIQILDGIETGLVFVTLDENGFPSYEIKQPSAWDNIGLKEKDLELMEDADAFIFGSLASRTEKSRKTLLALLEKAKFKVFDINLRPPHYTTERLIQLMEVSDFVKLNDDEIIDLCHEFLDKNADISMEDRIEFISQKTNTSQICVTLGSNGAILFVNNQFFYNKGYKVTVADTVGAGDSFLATLISKILDGSTPQEAIDFASAIGALVASKKGATPTISDDEIKYIMGH